MKIANIKTQISNNEVTVEIMTARKCKQQQKTLFVYSTYLTAAAHYKTLKCNDYFKRNVQKENKTNVFTFHFINLFCIFKHIFTLKLLVPDIIILKHFNSVVNLLFSIYF